jgi:hypothetical protein
MSTQTLQTGEAPLDSKGVEKKKKEPRVPTAADNKSLSFLACIAIIWFVVNLMAFAAVSIAPVDFISMRYTAEQIAYLQDLPTWSLLISGLCVGFGLVASFALYFRREEAYWAYMLSLLMAIAHLFDTISRGGIRIMSAGDAAASMMIMLFSLFLFWASYDAREQGQLK